MIEIQDIFPTPIGIAVNQQMSNSEHSILLNLKYHTHPVYNMTVTEDKYVFNTAPSNIKQFITTALNDYSEKTLGTSQRLRVTQSWCTKHDGIPQETFAHVHQNSIVSGVYYVSADESNAGITFYRDTTYNDNYISWDTDEQLKNKYQWNWDWYKFKATAGMLILFPSRLKHGVIGGMSNNVRCSLAFNTWFEGEIGTIDNFTRL
jgi:uncharacterized protein (TIGR02466 family)